MEIFNYLVSTACVIIVLATLWAALSENVRDGLPVKISLSITSLSAYLAFTNPSPRTLGMVLMSISAVCITGAFQKFILCNKLYHNKNKEKYCMKVTKHKVAAR